MTESPDKPKLRDQVQRHVLIRGPIERAFAALTDASLFPTWGPLRIEGKLEPGQRPVLDFGPAGGGKTAIYVVAIEAPSYFAYRWPQGTTDPAILLADPLAVPNTLVEFRLEAVEGGTRVTVTESGISQLPSVSGMDPDTAIEHMGEGWQLMLGGLERYFDPEKGKVSDRIENERLLAAPRERAFSTLTAFTWWAERVEGSLTPGSSPVLDFGQFGKSRIHVVALEPGRYFAFRWSPMNPAADPAQRLADPLTVPNTLVELRLEDAPGGTRLLHSESGFVALPDGAERSQTARAIWGMVLGLLERATNSG
ncbi:MAG: SRPBCC domain-containing protein [Polyangiaceae bacterium]